MTTTAHPELEGLDRYKSGWADRDTAGGNGLQITASRASARQRHRRPDGADTRCDLPVGAVREAWPAASGLR